MMDNETYDNWWWWRQVYARCYYTIDRWHNRRKEKRANILHGSLNKYTTENRSRDLSSSSFSEPIVIFMMIIINPKRERGDHRSQQWPNLMSLVELNGKGKNPEHYESIESVTQTVFILHCGTCRYHRWQQCSSVMRSHTHTQKNDTRLCQLHLSYPLLHNWNRWANNSFQMWPSTFTILSESSSFKSA